MEVPPTDGTNGQEQEAQETLDTSEDLTAGLYVEGGDVNDVETGTPPIDEADQPDPGEQEEEAGEEPDESEGETEEEDGQPSGEGDDPEPDDEQADEPGEPGKSHDANKGWDRALQRQQQATSALEAERERTKRLNDQLEQRLAALEAGAPQQQPDAEGKADEAAAIDLEISEDDEFDTVTRADHKKALKAMRETVAAEVKQQVLADIQKSQQEQQQAQQQRAQQEQQYWSQFDAENPTLAGKGPDLWSEVQSELVEQGFAPGTPEFKGAASVAWRTRLQQEASKPKPKGKGDKPKPQVNPSNKPSKAKPSTEGTRIRNSGASTDPAPQKPKTWRDATVEGLYDPEGE